MGMHMKWEEDKSFKKEYLLALLKDLKSYFNVLLAP